jgi:hypothetical protein
MRTNNSQDFARPKHILVKFNVAFAVLAGAFEILRRLFARPLIIGATGSVALFNHLSGPDYGSGNVEESSIKCSTNPNLQRLAQEYMMLTGMKAGAHTVQAADRMGLSDQVRYMALPSRMISHCRRLWNEP